MYDELCIAKNNYLKLLKIVPIEVIYKYREKYGPGVISLYYYIDARGRFTKVKYLQDHIANAIFEELSSKEKLMILKYLEDSEENFN